MATRPGRLALAAVVSLGLTSAAVAQDAQSRLWAASVVGDTAAIRLALDDGARVDSLDTRRSRNGRRPLNWAALGDHVPAIEMLLARGAPINGTNLTGFTALHHAAEAGSVNAARALLIAGADVTLTTQAGVTAAEVARGRENDAVATLIEAAQRGERPRRP